MRVDNSLVIFEGAQIVARNAVAFRIHTRELPLRQWMALSGRELERPRCPSEVAGLVSPGTIAESLDRRGIVGGCLGAVERHCAVDRDDADTCRNDQSPKEDSIGGGANSRAASSG